MNQDIETLKNSPDPETRKAAEMIEMREAYPPITVGTGLRIRVNVSRSVKGVYSPEVTVEGDDGDRVLAEHDRVFTELEKRYPFGGEAS